MLALAARLPTTSDGRNFPDQFRRAADYADKILCGARSLGNIPVVINLRTAKVMGLNVPATLLARADEVIE
jgi:putative tryptophan/tyrosine transport system substrate-binding protein